MTTGWQLLSQLKLAGIVKCVYPATHAGGYLLQLGSSWLMIQPLNIISVFRSLLKEIKLAGITRIVLDCDSDNIRTVLMQAQQVGMMSGKITHTPNIQIFSIKNLRNISEDHSHDPSYHQLLSRLQYLNRIVLSVSKVLMCKKFWCFKESDEIAVGLVLSTSCVPKWQYSASEFLNGLRSNGDNLTLLDSIQIMIENWMTGLEYFSLANQVISLQPITTTW